MLNITLNNLKKKIMEPINTTTVLTTLITALAGVIIRAIEKRRLRKSGKLIDKEETTN